ncbi:MAG: ABC transporter substrate-binding protein [Propioniciclava sp.]|uniref:ABC transporter substrate-binding protein n=1 Tax=Propioniciclava sp. TaxID=2038686 RepID=UPI0039E63499
MAEPTTLDPTATDAVPVSQALVYNVYETLVKLDSEGHLRPLLAQAWDASPDGLTYTFQLNPAATFSDGTKVTAQAVADNVERVRTQAAAPKLKRVMELVESTKVIDDSTIAITLRSPSVRWLYEMAGAAGIVMNPAGFETAGTQTAGSGPYTLDTWLQGDSLNLKKNTAYWGTPSRFGDVVFRYFKDAGAMTASMESGQLDIIANLEAPEMLDRFTADEKRYTVLQGSTNAEVTLAINNGGEHSHVNDPDPKQAVPPNSGNPALKDVRVRKAITMAIDRQALLDAVWSGKGTLIGSMAVPTDPYYEDLTGVTPYNPEEARRLLAESGHPNLTLRLRPAARPYATRSAQFVASQLKAVGIDVTVDELNFPATWVDTVLNKADYDLSIVFHSEPRDIFTFANPDYYWRYKNDTVIALAASADAGTQEEYVADLKQAARIVAEDAAAVWLFAMPNLVVAKRGITGIPANANGSQSFDVTTIARA